MEEPKEMTKEQMAAQIEAQRETITTLYKEIADLKNTMARMEIFNRKAFECMVNAQWRLDQYEATQKKFRELGK